MMNIQELKQALNAGAYDETFRTLYPGCWEGQRERYLRIADAFAEHFSGEHAVELYSAPGRSEIGGNHTDHQRGRVLAAAVTLDAVAVAAKNDRNVIRIYSEGHGEERINLEKLEIVPEEKGTTAALIRGIAARFYELDLRYGGFDAYVSSDVLPGSGLSSSAAYEVLVGTILSGLYNGGRAEPVLIAKVGQFAENTYFGKPCGLMDQCASAVGDFCLMDFADPSAPVVESIPCIPADHGYALCLIDAGGSHAGLTDEYAAIPQEMGAVAALLGKDVLGETDPAEFYARLGELRGKVSDRALLRAMHFYGDNQRVLDQADALRKGDFARFLTLVRASGVSSMDLLQNIYPSGDPSERSLSLALALCGRLLEKDGAWRVHGGGFAGTVQAFVPVGQLEDFRREMESVFGAGTCHDLSVRPAGGIRVTAEGQA
ncbi:galactokinase family protein [Intestinimonas sp.]|uniref:galactokinase n=1 Tax=Intestinimonas sp. TaxID=1965293 RepID=UPI0026216C52|nr:galactokinase family protein [Intestinimonas sp.]